jgi:hypothetical protein
MKHRWAQAGLVLALVAFMPRLSVAQGSTQNGRESDAEMGLDQNYPNPVKSATRIPFTVGAKECTDQSKTYRVSLRIYDIFSKEVAAAVLTSGTGSATGGDALENLRLTCNKYTAYWDGKSKKTSQRVNSGIYFYRLEVNGRVLTKKMLVK